MFARGKYTRNNLKRFRLCLQEKYKVVGNGETTERCIRQRNRPTGRDALPTPTDTARVQAR